MSSPATFGLVITLATIFMLVSMILALGALILLRSKARSAHYHHTSARRGFRSYRFRRNRGSIDDSPTLSVSPSCPLTLGSQSRKDGPVLQMTLTPPTPAKGASPSDGYEYEDDEEPPHARSATLHPYLP
ncbi:hypothetical protein HYDPIDRAFT_24367 [Hydnomerulius pinastri MD-312]|nr:hypothetical protein HYDPIDRAFT_24367 [Hydnomerulius pinastri MD-312]